MKSPHTQRFKERKQRRRKAMFLVGLLVFLSFIASTLFGDSGILVNMRVKNEYRKLLSERDRLLEENRRLKLEIRALKTNHRKIEAIGRREFGFGRPGEIIYYFPPNEDESIKVYQTGPPEKGEP